MCTEDRGLYDAHMQSLIYKYYMYTCIARHFNVVQFGGRMLFYNNLH